MNIFITGSSGFIGSALRDYLQKNYSTYTLFTPTRQQLDLLNESGVDNYILDNKIDIIIHLANRGGTRDVAAMKNITEYNLRIFFNIAKHEKNVKKIISFGSGAEYGKDKPIVEAKEEDYLKQQPLDEYGFYKSIISKYIQKSTNIVQLRVFGAYGEGENYRFKFISNAIVKNLFHLPIVINKNVFFDYIYIDDLSKIIDWFIHNRAEDKIYNATSGKKIDLLSLANIINEISDFKSHIEVLHSGLNSEYTSSNIKILHLIKGLDFISYKDSILKMRAYFSNNMDVLDKTVIVNDPYLKNIDSMWK